MENLTTTEYYVLTGNYLERLVAEYLGFEYESVAENEWNNYSCYSSTNIRKRDFQDEFFQDYTLPSIEDRINKGNSQENISFHAILVYLVAKDVLPEGNYLIDPSW